MATVATTANANATSIRLTLTATTVCPVAAPLAHGQM
jgi:hypothetical protein